MKFSFDHNILTIFFLIFIPFFRFFDTRISAQIVQHFLIFGKFNFRIFFVILNDDKFRLLPEILLMKKFMLLIFKNEKYFFNLKKFLNDFIFYFLGFSRVQKNGNPMRSKKKIEFFRYVKNNYAQFLAFFQ